jgi:flagellin
MALTINTNIPSLNAQRNLGKSQGALAKSMQRLSSGLRINSARDDAAGLAISDRMTSQIRGLNQAVRNANDGISLAQTAEGAMQEATNILQRIRELSVQSANDTNSLFDRVSLQKEVSQLQQELNRIASSTEFNNKKLLDGTFTSSVFQVGANKGQTIAVSMGATWAYEMGDQQIVSNPQSSQVAATGTAKTADTLTTIVVNGNQTSEALALSGTESAKEFAQLVNEKSDDTGVDAEAVTNMQITNISTAGAITFDLIGSNNGTGEEISIGATITDPDNLSPLVSAINDNAAATGITARLDNEGNIIVTSAQGDDIALTNFTYFDTTGAAVGTATFTTLDANEEVPAGFTGTAIAGDGTQQVVVEGIVTFHSNNSYTVEATAGTPGTSQWLTTAFNASALENVADIDISTQLGAGNALKVVDSAIAFIDGQRANLGAVMNRFESTIANLNNVSENVSAARSRILDADIAQETSSMTKQNILQQAGVSILAQANQTPQLALQLLQG